MRETVSRTSSTMTGRAIPWPRRLRYLAEAAGFFVVIGFFRLFSVERASAVGAWIGRVGVAPTGLSKLARENLRAAYPDKTAEQIEALIRAMWDNLGRVMAEYAHLDKIRWKTAKPRIEVSGVEHIAEAQARGRGVLLVSAHFANWEVMPIIGHELGLPGAAVVRPANNPYVNRWLDRLRLRNGMPEIIAKGAAGTRRIFTLLRKGECICIMVDQRVSEGIPAPFFGRDALTTPAPAALALKLGAAVLPITNVRTGGAHFHFRAHPPIEPPNTGDPERDLVTYTAAINAFMETQVREHPEQWLWIHRRWVDPDAALRKRAQALSRGGATNATSNRV